MSHFAVFLEAARHSGRLIVQPRMGFATPKQMRAGLQSVKDSGAHCIGTLTLDSFTRCGDYEAAGRCLAQGEDLNGYPIMSHPIERTKAVLGGLMSDAFPVQVRHGTPRPMAIFRRLVDVGLDATEGGPISYCLPYGRVPLAESVGAWADACRFLADACEDPHLESFGGCMMGQLCPPSLLIAVAILECIFFRAAGMRSVSLSYAQGPSHAQDSAALQALRRLAERFLADTDWHVVVYTYMGVFPATADGALLLLADSARLAQGAGCERLIVKTVAESWQVPSVADNVVALRTADRVARACTAAGAAEEVLEQEIEAEAVSLIEAALNVSSDLPTAILGAFSRGLLDIPYCMHDDNAGRSRGVIDAERMLRWADVGGMPLARSAVARRMDSEELLRQLNLVAVDHDLRAAAGLPAPVSQPEVPAAGWTEAATVA